MAGSRKSRQADPARHPRPRRSVRAADERTEVMRRRLSAVLASSPAAIQILARDGTIELWSPGAEALYGCTAAEVVGRSMSDALPRATAEQVRGVVEQLEHGSRIVGLGAVHARRDGSRVDVSVTGSVVRSAAGAVDGYCILCVDISSRRKAEQEIAEALDGARQRIGREVHDTLGQQLTAVGLLLTTLRTEAERGAISPASLQHLEEVVGQARAQLRLLIKGVFPVPVDREGLAWALSDLAHETTALFGISCRVENDPEVAVADNFWATELYWIAREAVHNAVNHGRARHITITLTKGSEVVLAVQDDGTGAPRHIDETRGMGLRIMRHRSAILGGSLSIGRAPGGGTLVRCVCPLPPGR